MTEEDLVARGTGRQLIREDLAGAKVYVQVENGKIIGRSAERGGKEVEIVGLRITGGEGLTSGQKEIEEICYWCIPYGDPFADPPMYTCYVAPCDYRLG